MNSSINNKEPLSPWEVFFIFVTIIVVCKVLYEIISTLWK